ncbi:sensor histidine kinase [Dongia sedimenti]|uniref:histidine kinase n=1 Tax=Dongia sedimenti TaxID=3064282 RepID=A0ABU0YTE1_9PROT|nr:ATP-binding protein [Rhodospirillaceae bacterium R-7]
MAMRGIGLRITMIMSISLLVLMLAAAAAYMVLHRGDHTAFRLPLPDQVGAIADLVEQAPPEALATVLRAVNSDTLAVTVQLNAPSSVGSVPAPGISWILQSYISSSQGRRIEAMFPIQDDGQPIALQSDGETGEPTATTLPLRLVVTLKDNRHLVLETKRGIIARLAGFRLVLLLLVLAIALSSSALWFLRRQVGPIEQLAALVERVGPDLAAETTQVDTRSKQASPDLQQLSNTGGKETRQLAAAILRMQQRIRDLLAGRSRMLAAIGHDFGTYLTRLRLRSEFIVDPDQRASAIRDIENMDALITGTLTLAQSDQSREARETVDLVALVRRHAEGFASAVERVRFQAAEAHLPAVVQPIAFGRAVTNLISNALRYGLEADVSVRREDEEAVVWVEDRGPGIPLGERAIVLEPFHRRDSARNLDQAGFGLGLAIVADILRLNDATLAFEDREGGGLRVVVRVKVADDQG